MTRHLDLANTLVGQATDLSGRSFLLLQGHPSRFWGELGDALTQAGATVHKVHFCLADVVFWGRRPNVSYRGSLENWPDWLEDYVSEQSVTDIVYYADRFPYHVAAREIAEDLGLATWAIEFGYLRPDWLTFEPGGMGAYSTFDRSHQNLARLAQTTPDPDLTARFTHSFSEEAVNEVSFGLLSMVGQIFYPRYVSDRVFWPIFDYLSWIPKLLLGPRDERHANKVQNRLIQDHAPYFLLPMQIESDYQIRDNSPYENLEDFVFESLASFAQYAPSEARLVIKLHPLDSGLENWRARCARLARQHGLENRVEITRGGDLGQLIRGAQGVVLVNSTVGLHALQRKIPVIARGEAIYDIEGLTHQGTLDDFWTTPEPVSEDILTNFLRALTTIQVKGSFFSGEGRATAISTIVDRLKQVEKPVQRASVSRLRWRINNPDPTANNNAPSRIGKKIST